MRSASLLTFYITQMNAKDFSSGFAQYAPVMSQAKNRPESMSVI